MKLRNMSLVLHRFVGVVLGILLIVIGVSGSLLVFGHEIEQTLNPHVLQVTPGQSEFVSLETLRKTAQTTFPDMTLRQIYPPQQPDAVYGVSMTSKGDGGSVTAYINPYTGELLGSTSFSIVGFLLGLHVNLFAGEIGGQVVGVCGLALLLLGSTGLILWSGWKKLLSGFKIRWNAPWRLVSYDLHKVWGILSVLLLSLVAFTGTAMVFWEPFNASVGWITQTPAQVISEPVSQVQTAVSPMSLDELLKKADEALPGAKTYKIYLPTTPEGTFSVRKRFPSEILPYGQSYVYLDQYTCKVLQVDNATKAPVASFVVNLMYPLHIGHYGGLLTRVLYFIAGLAPVGLFVTGVIIWQNRKWAEARRKARHELVKKASSDVE